MKNTCKFIGLCGCLVCLGISGNAYGNPTSIPKDLKGYPLYISKQEIPLMAPKPETEYSMRIIKPNPDMDCKIVRVMPDPTIDYKIRIVDPKSRNSPMELNDRLEEIIR